MPFVIGIEGGYGSGKTLTSAIKAQLWKAQTGAEIFSNYRMRDAFLFEHYYDWYRVAHIHGTIIVFDESQKDWDSRRFAGSSQVDKTHIMNYVRKMNSTFVFVLPDFSDVDARVRKMCEILIHVERKPNGTMWNYVYDYTDKRYGEHGRLIKKEFMSYEKQKQIFALNLYHTRQMVMSFPMPEQSEVQEFFANLEKVHESAVKREYPNEKPIENKVKDDLEIDYIYNPHYLEEVQEDEQKPTAVFIPSAETSKKEGKGTKRGSKLVFA